MKNLLLLLALATTIQINGQTLATLTVPMPKGAATSAFPVQVNLDELTHLPDADIHLVEIQGKNPVLVPCQIAVQGNSRILTWLVEPNTPSVLTAAKRVFQLKKGKAIQPNAVKIKDTEGGFIISHENRPLWRYQYATAYPPQGVDTAYKKSGFIHPFWTPHGQALTRIQPPDHYHHYGLWNPWTLIAFEGDTVDCWNLKDRKGTVRFAQKVSTTEGSVFAEYQVVHQHIKFQKDGSERVMMNELQTTRIYQPTHTKDYYLADFTIQLEAATESPVQIVQYRYAGLGWRATEVWDNKNSEVLTSEGKNRKQADGTTARWCIIQGALGNDYGGAAILSNPANFNHPEPLRIWPEDQYKRGDMFGMFAPTKNKDWLIEPRKTYLLRYRFVVFNGKMEAAKAEAAWQGFGNTLHIEVKK